MNELINEELDIPIDRLLADPSCVRERGFSCSPVCRPRVAVAK